MFLWITSENGIIIITKNALYISVLKGTLIIRLSKTSENDRISFDLNYYLNYQLEALNIST